MSYKKIIAYINAENEMSSSILKKAADYEQNGADALFLYNYSKDENEREEFLLTVKHVIRQIDLPVMIGFRIKRFEDAKKALYTGAVQLVVPYRELQDMEAFKEASERFGADKMILELDAGAVNRDSLFDSEDMSEFCKQYGAGSLLLKHVEVTTALKEKMLKCDMPVLIRDSLIRNDIESLLELPSVESVSTNYFENKDIMKVKQMLKDAGFCVNIFESALSFEEFKLNEDGLIPVIVQDYKTNEVLMLAYMNKDAYGLTLQTGKMTYYSRSRKQLWLKGETSGHFQYVQALKIDCDNDTLLAKVKQIGAACHTGSYSCFYRDLVTKEHTESNPFTVLSEDYNVIMERKRHPKEGSYTNYLFDKGIDKILKKCGEEATEIVIAAKNPNADELKYEIADYLYHLMVLMAECDLDWNDITGELVNRRK